MNGLSLPKSLPKPLVTWGDLRTFGLSVYLLTDLTNVVYVDSILAFQEVMSREFFTGKPIGSICDFRS